MAPFPAHPKYGPLTPAEQQQLLWQRLARFERWAAAGDVRPYLLQDLRRSIRRAGGGPVSAETWLAALRTDPAYLAFAEEARVLAARLDTAFAQGFARAYRQSQRAERAGRPGKDLAALAERGLDGMIELLRQAQAERKP